MMIIFILQKNAVIRWMIVIIFCATKKTLKLHQHEPYGMIFVL